MRHYVSLLEANQHLSKYIDEVEKGNEVVITRRGKAIAKLTAMLEKQELSEEQKQARKRMLDRMRRGYHLGGERFNRDDIYER